mmetsp:Transcript_44627/g.74041  ORF Transcript_44627/g.74041 Transcript_44627/m.74041 type:complete len:581 (+) Transcript_44627:192-1934(+)|eukprot:CAMPEP_0119305128 /NCGR_PEP_ID=MMETSP1333-20130426/6197_1 /TAXON_ID=418940 /ORGANISM="Scyphosphaera apsteinii, Strain RCC1455" /LENGTH=580 /DNA_ID=CAMNT_0007308149 /DNA_START=182 /DNA_END=1924 /DNA_ORIENTATION=-
MEPQTVCCAAAPPLLESVACDSDDLSSSHSTFSVPSNITRASRNNSISTARRSACTPACGSKSSKLAYQDCKTRSSDMLSTLNGNVISNLNAILKQHSTCADDQLRQCNRDELLEALDALGFAMKPTDVDPLLALLNCDGNDSIDYSELSKMMCCLGASQKTALCNRKSDIQRRNQMSPSPTSLAQTPPTKELLEQTSTTDSTLKWLASATPSISPNSQFSPDPLLSTGSGDFSTVWAGNSTGWTPRSQRMSAWAASRSPQHPTLPARAADTDSSISRGDMTCATAAHAVPNSMAVHEPQRLSPWAASHSPQHPTLSASFCVHSAAPPIPAPASATAVCARVGAKVEGLVRAQTECSSTSQTPMGHPADQPHLPPGTQFLKNSSMLKPVRLMAPTHPRRVSASSDNTSSDTSQCRSVAGSFRPRARPSVMCFTSSYRASSRAKRRMRTPKPTVVVEKATLARIKEQLTVLVQVLQQQQQQQLQQQQQQRQQAISILKVLQRQQFRCEQCERLHQRKSQPHHPYEPNEPTEMMLHPQSEIVKKNEDFTATVWRWLLTIASALKAFLRPIVLFGCTPQTLHT